MSSGALRAQKFTFGGLASLMTVASLFTDMAGSTSFLMPSGQSMTHVGHVDRGRFVYKPLVSHADSPGAL